MSLWAGEGHHLCHPRHWKYPPCPAASDTQRQAPPRPRRPQPDTPAGGRHSGVRHTRAPGGRDATGWARLPSLQSTEGSSAPAAPPPRGSPRHAAGPPGTLAPALKRLPTHCCQNRNQTKSLSSGNLKRPPTASLLASGTPAVSAPGFQSHEKAPLQGKAARWGCSSPAANNPQPQHAGARSPATGDEHALPAPRQLAGHAVFPSRRGGRRSPIPASAQRPGTL